MSMMSRMNVPRLILTFDSLVTFIDSYQINAIEYIFIISQSTIFYPIYANLFLCIDSILGVGPFVIQTVILRF